MTPKFTLAWPTAGRRECLLASIDGFARNALHYGHSPSFLIASDSQSHPQTGMPPDLAAGIAAVEKELGITVNISAIRDRELIVQRLKGQFDRELLEYALLPSADWPGWGVNVNTLFLYGKGGFAINIDDDILAMPARLKARGKNGIDTRLGFYGEQRSTELRYYRSREALLEEMEELEVDILKVYGEVFANPMYGKINIISPGYYGDSGMGSSRGILSLEDSEREALMATGYEDLRLSRNLVNIAPKALASNSIKLMAMQSAWDAGQILLPFMPYGRNSDGLAALLMRLVYPQSLTAYLDFGFYHNPPGRNSYSHSDLITLKPGLPEMLMFMAIAMQPEPELSAGTERMRAFGHSFIQVAELGKSGFVEVVHSTWSLQYSMLVEHLESLLDRYGRSPPAWAQDVDAHIESINSFLSEPVNLFGNTGCGLTIEAARQQCLRYGALLEIWPELWAAF